MGTYVRGTLEERFLRKVQKTDACWLWIGARCSGGYGCIGVRDARGAWSVEPAHRIAWELFKEPIPEGMHVLHDCEHLHVEDPRGSRRCVNPEHLWLGTRSDNAVDMTRKGRRFVPDQYGEKNGSAKLTNKHVAKMRDLYARGGVSQSAVARHFGVSQTQVSRIVRRKQRAL